MLFGVTVIQIEKIKYYTYLSNNNRLLQYIHVNLSIKNPLIEILCKVLNF